MRILVVEDEMELCGAIAEGLELDGYAVDTCYDGAEAHALILVEPYDLVVLDLNLPGMDGMDLLEELRRANREVKVLILSARDSVEDKVKGLDAGANDYLAKPFAFAELEARVRNLLRWSFVQEDAVLRFAAISLDTQGRIAVYPGPAGVDGVFQNQPFLYAADHRRWGRIDLCFGGQGTGAP